MILLFQTPQTHTFSALCAIDLCSLEAQRLNDPQGAQNDFDRAIELNPDVAEFRGGHIEALVASANGVVTSEARAAIEDALRHDPKNVRARFFNGLAKEQAGDKAAALADWTALRNDAGPSDPKLHGRQRADRSGRRLRSELCGSCA